MFTKQVITVSWVSIISIDDYIIITYHHLDAVVVELVVGSQCGQGPRADGVCEEDLHCGVNPALGGVQLGPVGGDVEQQPLARALQRHGFEEERDDHEVREQRREPHYLNTKTGITRLEQRLRIGDCQFKSINYISHFLVQYFSSFNIVS